MTLQMEMNLKYNEGKKLGLELGKRQGIELGKLQGMELGKLHGKQEGLPTHACGCFKRKM